MAAKLQGRVTNVSDDDLGSSLDGDHAAGATTLVVADAADFDEDGGTLVINDQQIVYTSCDDDTDTITLAEGLATAAEDGDTVSVWDPLREVIAVDKTASVDVGDDYSDDIEAVVALHLVEHLAEGPRGDDGESVVLELDEEDHEWKIVDILGLGGPGASGTRWEQDDFYTLTSADITAGVTVMPLSKRPNDEALTCVLASVPQRPTEWTINYDAQTLTIPLDGWERAGDVAWVHYAYRKAVATSTAVDAPSLDGLPLVGWYSADYAATAYSDGATMSGWTNLVAGGANATGSPVFHATGGPGGGPRITIPLPGSISFSGVVLGPGGAGSDTDGGEMFLAIKADSTTVKSDWFNFGNYGFDTNYPNTGGGVIDDFGSSTALLYTPTLPIDQWRRYDTWSAPNDRAALIDEVVQASSATNVVHWYAQTFGNTGGVGFKGSLAAVLLFDRKLTAGERAQVVEFLQAHPSGGLPS